MPRGLHGKTDAGLHSWSRHFRDLISSDPETYGFSVEQAAVYAAQDDAYAAAYQAASNLGTRSKVIVIQKNEQRTAMLTLAASYVKIVQANLSLSDEQKVGLGIDIPVRRTRIPTPTSSVKIQIRSVSGFRMMIRLLENGNSGRGKPPGVAGASIWTFIGDEPPTSIDQWTFERNTTTTSLELRFSSQLAPGTKVWLCAAWFNPRTETGPLSNPISTHLQGGVPSVPMLLAA